MAKTISIYLPKGGVGKTTITFNLGHIISKKFGKKVLLIDNDSQGNLTVAMNVPGKMNENNQTLSVYLSESKNHEIIPVEINENLFLLTANSTLANIDQNNQPDAIFLLSDGLDKFKKKYDIILIDCPPSLSKLSISALLSSEYLIVPITPDGFSSQSLSSLLDIFTRVKKPRMNPKIQILGIIFNEIDNTALAKVVSKKIKEFLGDQIFDSMISSSVRVKETQLLGVPICRHAPSHKTAKQYDELATEIMGKLENDIQNIAEDVPKIEKDLLNEEKPEPQMPNLNRGVVPVVQEEDDRTTLFKESVITDQ